MEQIRVILADDHTILRQGLRSLLAEEEDIVLVGEATDGREAVQLAEELQPDVIVMDISMQMLNGVDATRQILSKNDKSRVIILSIHDGESYISSALRAGAAGYILKNSAFDELKQAIRAAARGELYLSPAISPVVVEGYLDNLKPKKHMSSYERLTPRQRELLQLLAEGYARRQIAELLHISPKTVSRHREDIMHSLDIHDDAGLVKFAINVGIVDT